MRRNSTNVIFIAIVIGILVLLNIIGLRNFMRFDLTAKKVFTLSQASVDIVKDLKEPVTVTAYFSEQLPVPYSENARYLRDLLEEFRSASKGKLSFEFTDPTRQESDADKEKKKEVKRDIFGRTFREQTQIEKDLSQLGVPSVEIAVLEDDKRQTKRAYMGIVIRHQEKKEVIPVVQDVRSLEYDLTVLIRKLTRSKSPVVVLAAPSELQEKFRQLSSVLSQNYEVRNIDLGQNLTLGDDIDALWVLGPKTALSVESQKAIDQFILKGKSVGFFLDNVHVDLKAFNPSPVDHGLSAMLGSYGFQFSSQLVADAQSAQLNVQEQRGFMMIAMPVPYPFIPMLVRLEGENPVSKGLTGVPFPFASKVTFTAGDGRTYAVLAKSGKTSWLESAPYNLDPRRDWRNENIVPNGPHDLMVSATGKFKSHFAADNASGAASGLTESQAESRLMVAGTSSLFWDEFMQGPNQLLALNVADWMVLDSGLINMRSRDLVSAPLKPEISDVTRNSVKSGNMLGTVVLLGLYGFVRWTSRNSRRQAAKVQPS